MIAWFPDREYSKHDPKPKPSAEAAAKAMTTLVRGWHQIVGDNLATVTRPIGLTGAKSRRLLVEADGATTPPWGEWSRLVQPGPFRALRMAVNTAIASLQVDHIDFIVRHPHERRFQPRQV